MKLIVTNSYCLLKTTDRALGRKLDQRTSYKVAGYVWSEAYRRGGWDGKEHLCKTVKGGIRFPVGLIQDVLQVLENLGAKVEVEDRRRESAGARLNLLWHREDIELRPYQQEAVDSVFEDRGFATGKGLLNLPTRSGKTVIAAAIIHRLDRPALFIVPADLLLKQAADFFETVFRVPVGRYGGGDKEIRPITVASVQSLMRGIERPEVRRLLESVDLVFFDEVHHVQGQKFRDVLMACDAFYKVGLSATIFLTRKGENETGTIHLKGATGRILYTITPSYLIEHGFLVQPTIELYRVTEPDLHGYSWSEELYSRAIADCDSFNSRVIRLTKEALRERGYRTALIPCKRIEHAEKLHTLARHHGLKSLVLIGPTPASARAAAIGSLRRGELEVLIGTIFGEGVDIPEVDCVVNAEGLKSRVAALQRLRNLTPSEGKDGALVIDFMFMTNRYLTDHSLARLKEYKRHGAFRLVVVE